MSRLCRLKNASHGEDGAWAYDEIVRLRAEVTRLRMYAPGGRAPHEVRVAPRVGPTNFAFFGMPDVETDFDTFGHAVPNESEL